MSSFFDFFETCAVVYYCGKGVATFLTHRASFVWQQTCTTSCGASTTISSLASLVSSTNHCIVSIVKDLAMFQVCADKQSTVHSESIQTPWLLHILFRYSLILKLIKLYFSLINLHPITHNDIAKTDYSIFLCNLYCFIRKCYIYLSIQTLYLVLCWSTFGSNYSLESSKIWRYKLGPLYLGSFSHSSL